MTSGQPTEDLLSSKIEWIRLEDFENLCFRLAREHLNFNQLIPDFVTRNPGTLESCLRTPLQKFSKKDLYPTFTDKLSILFYLMIKNHPFLNGNKRIALTTLLTVLYLNGKWIKRRAVEVYLLAKKVSGSDREDKDKQIRKIKKFLIENIINL